jgi:serine protein kinase
MGDIAATLRELSNDQRELFRQRRAVLPFSSYLDLVRVNPEAYLRNAARYLLDTFDHFGLHKTNLNSRVSVRHFKLFEMPSERSGPIIGGEWVQEDIYNTLKGFVQQGAANKLILMHGPNGSAKSCSVEAMAHAMGLYSESEAGAVYRFNWIFPTDRSANPKSTGETGPIGFGGRRDEYESSDTSFAMFDESRIACKLHSEFKDNPIFLLPMPDRERLLKLWIANAKGISVDQVALPAHVLCSGLSKKNQLIFENLLNAYDGDVTKVYRHVQVERFYYSSQYRVGVASVEPRMSVDAAEQQLTMDKNLANLPSFLSNIRFHEAFGPLIEANRGILEFSDMLKRPVEAFKYLLSTVEKGLLDLPSSTAQLDVVFFGTTNEKHLDAFKTIPDFSSFRSRFHLITVPYLLRPSEEIKIYERDLDAIRRGKAVCPHALELLCNWAVMTRYKQPDPEHYPPQYRQLVGKVEPHSKVALYDGKSLKPDFNDEEDAMLRELRWEVFNESRGTLVYEGRFGASPREVKSILYRAAQNVEHETLTPMAIFEELENLVKDRTVYEFLQFEPRGRYHDTAVFIEIVRKQFAEAFEREVTMSMTLVSDVEYDNLLRRYVSNVVAFVKKERLFNEVTNSNEPANEKLMSDVEGILGVNMAPDRHRESMLSRIGAYKMEKKVDSIDVVKVFDEYLRRIQDHYHKQRQHLVDDNFKAMLALTNGDLNSLSAKAKSQAEITFEQLQSRFGYDRVSAQACLKFLIHYRKHRKQTVSSGTP